MNSDVLSGSKTQSPWWLWLASGFVALVVVPAGAIHTATFFGYGGALGAQWSAHFEQFGYPQWFHLPIGLTQVAGGLSLFWPKGAVWAGLAVSGVMAGAALSHLKEGEIGAALLPAATACIAAFTAYFRWRIARKARSSAAPKR